MESIIDVFLHLDTHLTEFVAAYGRWVYAVLFLIIFAETGLVVTPILPGDSLLFAAGALAATGSLDIRLVVILLIIAAILGDAVNYAVGKAAGPRIFRSIDRTSWWQRLLNREHLARAHEFFEIRWQGDHPGPVRPHRPYVRSVRRGRGDDDLSDVRAVQRHRCGDLGRDLYFSGYAFGNVPVVRDNFSLVAIGIILVSMIPIAIEYLKQRRAGA